MGGRELEGDGKVGEGKERGQNEAWSGKAIDQWGKKSGQCQMWYVV